MGSSSAWPTPAVGRSLPRVQTAISPASTNLTRFANYGTIAAIGRRHTIAANYIYDLSAMFGRHEIVHSLMDGWRIPGLTRFQSGAPSASRLSVTSNSRARNRKLRGFSLFATHLRLRPTARITGSTLRGLHLDHAISDAVRLLTAWNSRARPDVTWPNCLIGNNGRSQSVSKAGNDRRRHHYKASRRRAPCGRISTPFPKEAT